MLGRVRIPVRIVTSLSIVSVGLAFVLASRTALAAQPDDCPPGSVGKDEGGFQWCEPTVCVLDADCGSGRVCRSMPFCVEIGNVADGGAGKRLVVHNRCGANNACPPQTTCLEGKRCIDTNAADRMGILVEDAGAPAEPSPKKSICGCSVPGVATTDGAWLAVAAVVGASVLRRKRRALG